MNRWFVRSLVCEVWYVRGISWLHAKFGFFFKPSSVVSQRSRLEFVWFYYIPGALPVEIYRLIAG